jgi:hypothetical protein
MWSLKEKETILTLTSYNFCISIVILNFEVTIHMICISYLLETILNLIQWLE